MRRRIILVFAVVLGCLASDARAQSEAAIAVGLSVSTYDPTGQLSDGSTNIGSVFRLKTGAGLGPAIGFGWHTFGVYTAAGSQRLYLGRLRVWPVMAGVEYSLSHGKWSPFVSLVGGYAFNKLNVDDRARPAFRSDLGATLVSLDVANSAVFRAQAGIWYDVAPRVGVMASIAYMGMRPALTITSDLGIRTTHIDAASTVLSFGLAYGVF